MHSIRYQWPAILWAILILTLSIGNPPREMVPDLFQIDKVGHVIFYGILTILIYTGSKRQYTFMEFSLKSALISVGLTIAYGYSIELMQESLTENRLFDHYDALANTIGAVIGILTVKFYF